MDYLSPSSFVQKTKNHNNKTTTTTTAIYNFCTQTIVQIAWHFFVYSFQSIAQLCVAGSKCFVTRFNFVDAIIVIGICVVVVVIVLRFCRGFAFDLEFILVLPSFISYPVLISLLAYTSFSHLPSLVFPIFATAPFRTNWYMFELLRLHYFMLYSMQLAAQICCCCRCFLHTT